MFSTSAPEDDPSTTPPPSFSPPIEYLPSTVLRRLSEDAIKELELTESTNPEEVVPVLHPLYAPQSVAARQVLAQTAPVFTVDTGFLRQTQKLLKSWPTKVSAPTSPALVDDMVAVLDDVADDVRFCETYCYTDWGSLKFLNEHQSFLTAGAVYHIASPATSLFMPLVIFLLPLIILFLQMRSSGVSLADYLQLLRRLAGGHVLANVLLNFGTADTGQKAYMVVSILFYALSVYQTVHSFLRFRAALKRMTQTVVLLREYLRDTQTVGAQLQTLLSAPASPKPKYQSFSTTLGAHLGVLNAFLISLETVPAGCPQPWHVRHIGKLMHVFYQLHGVESLRQSLRYSVGFNGYVEIMHGAAGHLAAGRLMPATFLRSKVTRRPRLRAMMYPAYLNHPTGAPVVNDCDMSRRGNLLISGPNASGKTTYIKSAMLNLLLSQQLGMGCFKSCRMTPFDQFHCYLNIPDTSGRDSLFQAEARRCKTILDAVVSGGRHFCVFDELYSGTNPEDAVQSAVAVIRYLCAQQGASFLLTTHYRAICEQTAAVEPRLPLSNDRMLPGGLYRMEPGISTVNGGAAILDAMAYPADVLAQILPAACTRSDAQ